MSYVNLPSPLFNLNLAARNPPASAERFRAIAPDLRLALFGMVT